MLVRTLHVGEAGSLHDRRVLRRSPLLRDLLLGPADVFLSADEHLVGDGGYGISDFVSEFSFTNLMKLFSVLLL